MDLTNKDELLAYLKLNGLWAQKGLGQNFLVDKSALDKIVQAAELSSDDLVVEVGPGTGVLTGELVKRADRVVAIEMDEKLADLLEQRFCHSREGGNLATGSQIKSGMTNKGSGMTGCDGLKIVNADILKVNLDEILGGDQYKVVANIPYYITSKILELFLSREQKPEAIVLLVQKEVAERICAKPGEMSVLSVSVQLYGKPEIVGIVPASSFFPAPKVDSAILKIVIARDEGVKQSKDRHASLAMTKEDEKSFFRLVHIGFASRRKTLANNLAAGYHIDKNLASDIIKSINLKDSVRAQELSIENWRELCLKILKNQN